MLTITADTANRDAIAALRAYYRASARASHPSRTASAWALIQSMLWSARQDLVATGVLSKKSQSYELISARYRDASFRYEAAKRLERESDMGVN